MVTMMVAVVVIMAVVVVSNIYVNFLQCGKHCAKGLM